MAETFEKTNSVLSVADTFAHHENKEEDDQIAGAERYDEVEVRKVLRRVDVRLLPLLTLLYLISFLDRGNIGNARVAGLQKDLGLTDGQYNLCLTVFFFSYAFFEVPSNIVLKILRPRIWIPIIVLAWGTVMTLMGVVQNFGGLVATRFFLGLAEAGFFPASTYVITTWYTRHEIQTRIGVFFCAGSLAGAFSGLLAFAIQKMDGIGGLEGWRWIFILEGLLTLMVGMACAISLPNGPQTARFLSAEEKDCIIGRLKRDAHEGGDELIGDTPFEMRYLYDTLKDWKIYLSVIIFWGNSISTYGFIFSLPIVIKGLGYSAANAQLLTIPIYATALLVTIITCYYADHTKQRSPFIIYPFMLAVVAYAILIALPKDKYPGARYGMLFVVAAGLYPSICTVIAWNANNLAGPWKRAIGIALQLTIGNLGGAIGSNIYLQRQAPHYWLGYGFSLAIILCAITSAYVLRFLLSRQNKQRERMTPEEIYTKYSPEELKRLGDKSPFFKYTL
ncbi:uncharacterized protein A1O5_07289 [Cladophialophora psammophila CBS 110553]|uniref:Major facilitator superfamily (MFS) profile domain-containing protein n=1 Tax=Cladophialophora psammophila CBS 110553 TaxID=1182543 RepID=W9WMX9_9EURO|nr:uncharacterized protein A1O5_07289 [Cladophialophora psammophila CBS 110553]EXJ69253.1 hypothetical protein A1O5_07289 [Cladophialophora psammophila CBS 110553]